MTEVETAIKKGLSKAKDSIIKFMKELCPNTSTRALENTQITHAIDWNIIQLGLAPAAEFTAHARYQSWYNLVFRGTKRAYSDEEYTDEHLSNFISPAADIEIATHRITCSQKVQRLQ